MMLFILNDDSKLVVSSVKVLVRTRRDLWLFHEEVPIIYINQIIDLLWTLKHIS